MAVGGPQEHQQSPMSIRYSRVGTSDATVPASRPDGSTPLTEEERKRARAALAERISNKLHAALWTICAGLVLYYTNFFRVLIHDERVRRTWLRVATICFSANCVIMFYLTVWLPHIRHITLSWNAYCPRAIPAATVIGIACGVTLNLALWNVWGFLTPLILFVIFFGGLFSLHFIPWPSSPAPSTAGVE